MSRYIDADAFYEDMCKRTDSDSWRDCWAEFVAILSSQPTADVVEVVHGEWLEDGEGEIYCSKCGKYTYDRHDEIKKFDGKTVIALCYPRYCGNCGANMRGDVYGKVDKAMEQVAEIQS